MKKSTLCFCLSLLDAQRAHMKEGSAQSVRIQEAYYDGMRRMLEAAVSEAYDEDYYITVTESGYHKILA